MEKVQHQRTDRLLESLEAEGVKTWFDLGLLLDRLREGRAVPSARAPADRRAFNERLARGVAFVTYSYTVDGVTMEVLKYASALADILPDPKLHFVGGQFDPRTDSLFDPRARRHEVAGLEGFDRCPVYRPLFHSRLERGSPLYNRLIRRLWKKVLELVERLGRLFEENDIELVFAVNTNSNPGNPALALALVLLAERFGLPVISNNHDFYWEGGHSESDRKRMGLARGPRDHFFINAHLGEVFSIIQRTHPWEGRSWLSLNLSTLQCDELIGTFGHNPANVAEVGTAVDTQAFGPLPQPRRIQVLQQLASLLGGDEHVVPVCDLGRAIADGRFREPPHTPALLGHRDGRSIDFPHDNIILLQPTRIIARKRIELNLEMIATLFQDPEFAEALRATPSLKLTLVVTGPVAGGQQVYWNRLLEFVDRCLETLPDGQRDRVFFAPLFAGIDSAEFRERFEQPATIGELYGIASLVCLPSETEGRGLPIVEAAACGVPCLVCRYEPEAVYAHVIGEHLAAEDRLQVIEFRGQRIGLDAAALVRSVLLHPQAHSERGRHNRRVVEKRYSMAALTRDVEETLHRLRHQLQTNRGPHANAAAALERFRRTTRSAERHASDLLDTRHREYLPGYGRMGFMLMLKSLIDPSYFRAEEQRMRGIAFAFARRLVEGGHEPAPASRKAQRDFYDAVDSLFLHHEGEMPVMFDHAIAYRHRNRLAYPYRELTPQELSGVINWLHHHCCSPEAPRVQPEPARAVSSWAGAVEQLCGGAPVIDQRTRLHASLVQDRPFAFFPGTSLQLELDLFVLHAVRARLGLHNDEPLLRQHLEGAHLAPIFVMLRQSPCSDAPTSFTLERFLKESPNEELRLIFKSRTCLVIATHELSPGVNIRQLGRRALSALRGVKAADGFLLATAEQAAMTTDIVDLKRFHVGRATDPFYANVMGIEPGQGFVQWVPAGLRFTLAYPTPIQTGKSLAAIFEGPAFHKLCDELGEKAVVEALHLDAAERGSPVERVLEDLGSGGAGRPGAIRQRAINGVYDDGHPWSGNLATVEAPLRYRILSSDSGPRTVIDFVTGFAQRSKAKAQIAWNGGYILNPELVGKLGLPESYISSPLGLVISDGQVLCPPLYNKPAFMVDHAGRLALRRVTCGGGLAVACDSAKIDFDATARNPEQPGDAPCYYDLLFSDESLPGNGRTLVRLVGNRIIEIVETERGQSIPVFPVGLVLSFAPGTLPAGFQPGAMLTLYLPGLEGIAQAVEAGPLLVDDGKVCIDMVTEGWKTQNSIRTQAARLDFLDMRGPKIAAGLDDAGRLTLLTVNGRIRESVGATHVDMAEIFRDQGLQTAMGFDPGGSSTLVVGGKTVNISPYNRAYEERVFSLPPEPRAVANVVLGY